MQGEIVYIMSNSIRPISRCYRRKNEIKIGKNTTAHTCITLKSVKLGNYGSPLVPNQDIYYHEKRCIFQLLRCIIPVCRPPLRE